MSAHDDRLAALEAELAAMKAARVQEQQAKEDLYTLLPAPKPTAANAEIQDRQQRAVEERRRVHEQWQRRYEEQLEKQAPKIERLKAGLADLNRRCDAENGRHADALGEFGRERQALLVKLAELERPPEMPSTVPDRVGALA